MDSPDRDLTISAAEVQGSPLFNFLCSLSPIKPVKSMHVAQAFSDLTFPPPPAVFVSPKADAQDSSSSQRNQSTSKAELGQTGAGSSQVTGHSERRKLLPTVTERLHNLEGAGKQKNAQEKDQPSTSSSSSLANYVEQYLDEPAECEVDAVGSSSESLALNTCRSKPPILDSNSENGVSIAGAGACKLNKCEKASSSVVSSDALESQGSDVAEQQIVDVNVLQSTLEPDASSAGCHEGSDYSFLLPSGVDKLPAHGCADDWQSQLSSLSDLSIQEMAKYLATLKEIISEGAPDAGTDALCSQVSNVCTAEFKADAHGMTDQEIDNAVKNDKQDETAFRANTLPLRGVRRRCLDFELQEGPEKSKTSVLSLKSRHANENIRSQSSPLCSKKIPESLLRERASATSGATNSEPNLGMDVCIQPRTSIDGKPTTKVVLTGSSMLKLSSCLSLKDSLCKGTKSENQLVCARRASGTSPVGMPSGIGLHLNSLTGGTPILQSLRETEGASSKSIIPVASPLQQDLEENCKNHLPVASSDNNSPYQTGTKSRKELLVSLVEKTSTGECELHWEGPDRLVSATKSMTCFRTVTLGIKQADNIVPSCRVEKKPSPLGRKRVLLPDLPHQLDPDGVEDFSQSPPSPKKKRKSNSAVEKGGDGCKRCNCKKSKCLKLYCDCFAAGVYCVDSCTCQGCLNKPEFEETVLGTRQQIESRNPLAFAPKIVRGADPSPTNGDDCGETPASARHKRGCNCKRSQCLKKYCECYQAGVGCSDGCRCEGCKNLYGRKEALEESEDRGSQVERVDEQLVVDEMDMRDFGTEEQRDALTPITPFQNLGSSRSMKSRTATRRGFSSEELLSSGNPSGSPSRLLRSSKGMQSSNPLVSMPTQLPKAAVSPLSTPKMLKIGEFSPRWDGLGNICTLTPLPQAPLRPTPASVSAFDGTDCSSPSFSQEKGDQARPSNSSARHSSKFSQRLSLQASVCLNNHQGQTSINVQSTPSTPGFTSYSDSNPHFEDSGDISHEFVGSTEDDNTPEFLKDPVSGSSPIRLLKTSSPKQKRVSPPHYQTAREPSRRGLPSPGLRSGRKIILQAVPSVPHTPFSAGHEHMTQR